MKKYVVALKGENRLKYFFNALGSADFDIFWGVDGRYLLLGKALNLMLSILRKEKAV